MPTLTGLNCGAALVVGLIDAALAFGVDQRDLRNRAARSPAASTSRLTLAYMPGFSRKSGVGNLDFHRRRARRRIEDRRDARDPAVELLARERVDLDDRRVAGADQPQVLLDDVGDQAQRRDVDDRRDAGLFCETHAPGSTLRLATNPSTGDTTLVLPRLIRSSSSRDADCASCACDRSTCATAPRCSALRRRRASAWAGAGGHTGCASARRWSARD